MPARVIADNEHDTSSWYRGCILVLRNENKVARVLGVSRDTDEDGDPLDDIMLHVETWNGSSSGTRLLRADEVQVQYPEPYFNTDGQIEGSVTGRNYKRAPQEGEFSLRGMYDRLFNEEQITDNRIGFQYCIQNRRYPVSRLNILDCEVVVHINKGVVGFKRGEELHVFDEVHYDRLRTIIESLGGDPDVLVQSNPSQ
jgi:hypothetical protein